MRLPRLRRAAPRAVAVAVALVALAGTVTQGRALAFLSDASEPQDNGFSVALCTVEVKEEFDPEPDEKGRVEKTVRALNTGDCPCYVRALALPGVSSDFASFEWAKGPWSDPDKDGYRYYGKILDPGDLTDPLMTGLVLDGSVQGRGGPDPELLVYVECVQSEGFGDARQAFAALGGEGA